ncbi:DUF3833 domain-containing protein [Thalassospira sp. MCCC 1A01428]|uniref:DUF3833 domain-containing protein n=1 Tax=unclassified Thalassospira TaxID=2648997 RepID=UPI000A1EFDC1|nr:DUF3833 domain-containing protein [Thalassospira sp. MCCC 1A01428]
MLRLGLAFFMVVFISGCGAMKPQDFAQKEPAFDVFAYFQGHSRAWGIFEDRFGKLRRQFTVDINGVVEDGVLILTEDFVYDDGETDQRVWKISKTADHEYEGTFDEIVGIARGVQYGNALNWNYDMDLKVGDGTWRVSFDDWMFLQPNGVLVNRARVRKWGVEIGEISLFFAKPNAQLFSQAAE